VSVVISNSYAVEVGVRENGELESVIPALEDPVAQDVCPYSAHCGCVLRHGWNGDDGQRQHSDYCYFFDNLTPYILYFTIVFASIILIFFGMEYKT
jgi:hypothetical protein